KYEGLRTVVILARNRKFESISLQQRVTNELFRRWASMSHAPRALVFNLDRLDACRPHGARAVTDHERGASVLRSRNRRRPAFPARAVRCPVHAARAAGRPARPRRKKAQA